MNFIPLHWKLFRVGCILQLIAVAGEMMFSLGSLFTGKFPVSDSISILVHIAMFLFVYMALSIINYNYPDTPLSATQKKYFNWLFIINFLSIVFLFGNLVSNWRFINDILKDTKVGIGTWLSFGWTVWYSLLVFLFHVVFLFGMYRLRRIIFNNTLKNWNQQFETTSNSNHPK